MRQLPFLVITLDERDNSSIFIFSFIFRNIMNVSFEIITNVFGKEYCLRLPDVDILFEYDFHVGIVFTRRYKIND